MLIWEHEVSKNDPSVIYSHFRSSHEGWHVWLLNKDGDSRGSTRPTRSMSSLTKASTCCVNAVALGWFVLVVTWPSCAIYEFFLAGSTFCCWPACCCMMGKGDILGSLLPSCLVVWVYGWKCAGGACCAAHLRWRHSSAFATRWAYMGIGLYKCPHY